MNAFPPLSRLQIALAASIACVCIAAAAFYIVTDQPRTDETVSPFQKRLTESEHVVAQLREQLPAGSGASEDRFSAHASGNNLGRIESADLAAAEGRLEEIATRIELRLAQLEKKMKSSHLIPLTREELNAEIQEAQQTLDEIQEQANAQDTEVRRLALSLTVPEAIAKLSPWDAIREPGYDKYRAYFEAKIKAGYLQMYAKDQAQKLFGLRVLCS